jgi:hypothetical protein
MTARKITGLFAFWKYSSFPFVLGGTVVEMRPCGTVRTKEYVYMWFMPIKIMPVEAGKKLLAQLEKVRADEHTAQARFNKEWAAKIHDLLPEAKGL